ncbi:hypothetical protein [Anaeroselena agilis]|uniref:Uncharacterized protein n=1 Tax=Anaeroselena agilis TaxID=3063788 RepID=A0ABU3NSF6_9FIRM|nr:hypothetical protein [Selenomonadales bacterium 4137-cl]
MDFIHVSSRELSPGTVLKPYGMDLHMQKGLNVARLVIDFRPEDTISMVFVAKMIEWQLNNKISGEFANMIVEHMLEKTRQQEFPNRPSRLGSCFLFPETAAAQQFIKHYRESRSYIYKCKVEAENYVTCDMALINSHNIMYETDSVTELAALRERCVKYWAGEQPMALPEVIVPGVVKISGLIART